VLPLWTSIVAALQRHLNAVSCIVCLPTVNNSMTTWLEYLEMSGILTAVREMSGILLKVVFASTPDVAELVHFIFVLDHALLRSYPHH